MKRFFLAVVCAVALFSSAPAQAAPILVTDTDAFVGTVIFDLAFTPVFQAVGGASTANINDGAVFITNGTISGVDNDSALFSDLVDDAYQFDFNFASSAFDFGAGVWTLAVTGNAAVTTDAALLAFLGDNLGQFSVIELVPFIDGETQQQIGVIGTFALDFIASQEEVTAVPEPATLTLVGLGLAVAARRRAKKNNQAA